MSGGRKAPQLSNPEEISLWNKLIQMQGTVFYTSGRGNRPGVQFTYTIRGAEFFAPTKEKSITRASIISANAYTRSNKNPERELTDMPRPKGSKNKKVTAIVENVDEKIAALETDIEKLTAELKTKKAELKQLAKAKAEAEKAAAARKAEEDKKKLLAAVEQSGKSIDEILELLK